MLAKLFGAGALLLVAFVIVGVAGEYLACQDILKDLPAAQAMVDRNMAEPPKPFNPDAFAVRTDTGEGRLLSLQASKRGNMFCKNK